MSKIDEFDNPFMYKVPDKSTGYKSYDPNSVETCLHDEEKDDKSHENNESITYCGYINERENGITDDDYNESLTPSARQFLLWRIKTLFPSCPDNVAEKGLEMYYENLNEGALFSSNSLYEYHVVDKRMVPSKKTLVVLCEADVTDEIYGKYKSYNIVFVFIRKNYYAHFSWRTHSDIDIAMRNFKLLLGEEIPTEEEELNWDC